MTRSWITYVKIGLLWVIGGVLTLLFAVGAAISAGFSDNEGMDGSSAWPAAILTTILGLGVMTAWTVSIVRRSRRR